MKVDGTMVANRISLSEGKERAASESTVLSRVRKLESNDSRSHEKSHARKTVPSFARLAERSKHQKAESAPDDSRQEKLTESVSSIHPRMSYTRDDVDESKIVKDERIGLSSRESDVIDVPAPAPSVNPYTGPSCQHDIAQRALEPGGTRLLSKSTNMSFQRNFVGQKVDPKGFRGTTHSRRALSESPLRHMRKSDSPSSEARNKSVPYPDMTKFDDKDAEKKHRSSSVPRGFLDDAPASNYGTNAPETLKTSFGLARLHEDHSDGRLKVSSQFADSENAGLPILANHHWNKLHNVSVLNSKTDQMNKLIATNSSRGPGADYGLSQHFPVKESNGTSSTKTSLAAGGLTTLQRHHWDKSNKAAIVHERPYRQNKSKSEEVKSSSKFGNSTLSKHVVDSDVKWPNVQSEANLLNTGRQEFNDEPVLPLGLQNLNAQKYSRNQELSQNLKAASIVIQEDKASSVGTSSSSGKSSLSRRELSTVANRALKLYSVRVDSQPTRSVSSHVDNMLDGKQRSSNATMKMAPVPKNNGGKIANAPFAYGSAARLSERLTRAERFNALKESRHRPRWQNADDSILSNDLLLSPTKKNNHPIFGHTNRDHPVIETHDDFSVAPSDNSCSRRSKQLSKAMQQKADSFAAASPTRRMKTIRKQPEIVNTAPPKKLIPSQSRPLKSSPKKKPAKMNQRKTNDIGAGFSEHLHTTQQRKTNEIGAGLSEYPYATQSSSRYIPQRHAPSHGAEHSQYRSRNEMKESEYPLHDKSGVSSKYDVHDFIENELPTSNHRQSGDRRSFLSQDREHIIHRFDDPSISVAFSSDDDLSNILLPPMLHSPLMDSQGVSNSIHPHVREHVATQCKPREQSYNEGRNATAVPSTYEAYKISETPFSGFFDDGQATVGEDSAQDNTFTGSLNKHDMGQESSDSYGTRPDAFQWLHQKYGTHAPAQAPTVTDAELKSTNLGVFHKTKKVSVFNVARKESANDDDDDIFFGLEEVQTDDDDFPVRAALKSNKDHSSRITSGRLRVSVDRPGDDHIFQQQQRKMHDSLPKVGKIDATPGHSTELFETKVALDMVEKTSTLKNPSKEENLMHSGISVTSDMTSSLLVDKGWKARYRPNPVKTILEESQPVASNEDNATADEESLHDHTKSGTSLFTNLRSAFVKSIQQACKMPGK